MVCSRGRVLSFMTAIILGFSAPVCAQVDVARQSAENFISGLISASSSNDAAQVEAFLRDSVDMDYVFNVAFAPVTGVVSGAQRQRIEALMVRFTATQTSTFVGYVQDGEMRLDGVAETGEGIRFRGTYRDSRGDRDFTVLMATEPVNGRVLFRDLDVADAPSIVENLTYATESLAQVSPDANVWINAFEKALIAE